MLPLCKRIAEMDDTLYSWRNTRIAQYEGKDAGVLISYDGASYKRAALKTFTIVRDGGGDDFTQMTAEAEAGEWYIDTLAVMPEYRGHGIAKALLRDGIAQGTGKRVTLYVDPDHPWVVNLYRSVGFLPAGEAVIFNQTFKKMAVDKPLQPV